MTCTVLLFRYWHFRLLNTPVTFLWFSSAPYPPLALFPSAMLQYVLTSPETVRPPLFYQIHPSSYFARYWYCLECPSLGMASKNRTSSEWNDAWQQHCFFRLCLLDNWMSSLVFIWSKPTWVSVSQWQIIHTRWHSFTTLKATLKTVHNVASSCIKLF